MKKWLPILMIMVLASVLVFAGCGDDDDDPTDGDTPEDGDAPEDGDTPEDGDAPEDGDTPEDGDAPEDGDTPDEGMVGGACEANEDCATAFCMTTAVIQTLTSNDQIIITNGYCSSLNPELCTEEVNGHNVSAAFLGEGYEDFNVCLSPCEADADCRADDGNICFDPQGLLELGMTQEDIDAFFGGVKVCIPQTLLDAAMADMGGE